MEKDWIKDLRTKMQDYDSPEPEGLWEDIAASLDREGLSSGLSRKQRRGRVVRILSGFAAAAAVLLLALILWPQPENSVDVLSDASGQGAAEPEKIVSGTELPDEEAAGDVPVEDAVSGQGNPDVVSVSESAEYDILVADVVGTDVVAGDLSAEDVPSGAAGDVQPGKHSDSGEREDPIDVVKEEVRTEDLLADAGMVADAAVPVEEAVSEEAASETAAEQDDNVQKYVEKYS